MSNLKPDTFASRMKGYEAVAQPVLMHRTPVIIRVDGKNFSKFTRGMKKPFDPRLTACMQAAAMRLVRDAQNCKLAYTQSDEISLLLVDFKTLNTAAWFDNQVQKLASISAALATAGFASEFRKHFPENPGQELPVFDARCFNLPREEVANYFVWRQRDCERNSVSMVAQASFSHKELLGANRTQMMDMLLLQKGINWNELPAHLRHGTVLTKELQRTQAITGDSVRSKWVSADAPIFTGNRDFIEKFLREEEERV